MNATLVTSSAVQSLRDQQAAIKANALGALRDFHERAAAMATEARELLGVDVYDKRSREALGQFAANTTNIVSVLASVAPTLQDQAA